MPLMAPSISDVVGLLDIVAAHPVEDVAEEIELAVGVGGRGRAAENERGCVSTTVAAPKAPQRRRENLRIIRVPFRLRSSTMGWDRLKYRPF